MTAQRTVAYGVLIAPLIVTPTNVAGPPANHQMHFQGELPHDVNGNSLATRLGTRPGSYTLANGITAQFHLSVKRAVPGWTAYKDYYEMIVTYVSLLEKYAQRVDSTVTAKTGRVDDFDDEPCVHAYPDSATTRAGIAAAAEKLATCRVAIIGLGGTGSYVLDFLAKTKVPEIRIFDGDRLSQHNAYRAPGAVAREIVMAEPPPRKVDYFKSVYEKMHLNIVAVPRHVTEIGPEFEDIDFAFLCIDRAESRPPILEGLIRLDKSFIDVGMGVTIAGTSLGGTLRTTFSAPGHREHRHRIPISDVPNEYATNIQIAELNAMNAAFAVMRWKKHLGFYRAIDPEYSSVFITSFNRINDEKVASA